MQFYVMTLFPDLIDGIKESSIIGRAIKAGIIDVTAVNIRDFSKDKHHHVDDYPYGGGAGMLMQPGPVCDCFDAITEHMEKKPRVVYLTPQGRTFNQQMAKEFAEEESLIFLCGHYEGIDERAVEEIVTDEVSIGDFVLTGGELPAMIMIDAISRMVPGVLSAGSTMEESFSEGLLEYPQYTRPEVYREKRVPEILLSGNHQKIAEWRREQSLLRTVQKRPDLLKGVELSKKDKAFLKKLREAEKELE